MPKDQNLPSDFDFAGLLRDGKYPTPNRFTIEMGKLIREARKELGLSQADLAEKMNRRPATISDIENGKSDISVLTLASFAIHLQKPVSYFYPPSIVSDFILDVKTDFERDVLDIIRGFSHFGDQGLVLKLLDSLRDYYEEQENDLF